MLAATIALAFALVPHGYAYEHTWEYERMIAGAPSDASAPFAWRVLVPMALKLVPLPPRTAFLISTLASTLLTVLVLFAFLRACGVASRAAVVAAQLAVLSYPVALYLGFWGMVDPVSNLFVVLVLLAMARDRWPLAVAAMTLGALTKESTLALGPLVAWWWWRKPEPLGVRLARLAALLVPLGSYLVVHTLVQPVPGKWDLRGWNDLVHFWRTLWMQKAGTMGWPRWFAGVLVRSYGFLWIAALLGWAWTGRWRGVALYLVLASVALCAVATDWARMLGFGFVGVVLPVAVFLDRVDRDGRGLSWLALLLVIATVRCWLTLAPFGSMNPALTRFHPVLSLAWFTLGATAVIAARWTRIQRPGRISSDSVGAT